MKCDISVKLNKGQRLASVKPYGALSTIKMLTVNEVFDPVKFVTKPGKPATIKKVISSNGEKAVIKSAVLTNTNNMDLSKVTRLFGEPVISKFISGIGTTTDILKDVNDHFGNNGQINSSNVGDFTQVIIEDGDFDNTVDGDRDYFVIDEDLISKVRELAERSEKLTDEAFDKYLKTFIMSALQRGYSIHAKVPIDTAVIGRAINSFKALNAGSNVRYASKIQSSQFGETISDTESFLDTVDSVESDTKPFSERTDNDTLNYFLTKEERTLMNKFKGIPKASKAFIAGNVAKSFSNLIPNLKVRVMTTAEIAEDFNDAFASQKGFIIGGEIVINLDTFTPDTMFHEFGHFYMKWLDTYNPQLKKDIMREIHSKFPDAIEYYRKLYEDTGIDFSEDEIMEEVFVNKIGLDGFKGLSKIIDLDEIRASEKTYGNITRKMQNYKPEMEGFDISPFSEGSDIYFATDEDIKNNKHLTSIAIDTIEIPTDHDDHFSSLFRPDDSKPGSIAVGPHQNFDALTGEQYARNLEEAAAAYEYFLINGVDDVLIEKYNLSKDTIKKLDRQHDFIVSKLGTDVFSLPILSESKDKDASVSFADILFDFNAQYLELLDISKGSLEDASGEKKTTFTYKGNSIEVDYKLGTEQQMALKAAIDHAVSNKGNKSFTIQGSAGTGKTTIIKFMHRYLAKYHSDINITYASPTHSANVTLAESLIEEGVRNYPATTQSMVKQIRGFYEGRDYKTPKGALTHKPSGIYVIDESSMLSEDDIFWLKLHYGGFTKEEVMALPGEYRAHFFIDTRKEANMGKTEFALYQRYATENVTLEDGSKGLYIDTRNEAARLLFLGDSAQLPSVSDNPVLSSVFDTDTKVTLNKVYRTGASDLLKLLNIIRKDTKFKSYFVENVDGSIKFIGDKRAMFETFIEIYKTDSAGTAMMTYKNEEVAKFNREAKLAIDGHRFIQPGSTIIGYGGNGRKKVVVGANEDFDSVPNSLVYKVQTAKIIAIQRYSRISGASKFITIGITSKSDNLQRLQDRGMNNLKPVISTSILPLSMESSITHEGVTEEIIKKNKEALSKAIHKIQLEVSTKPYNDQEFHMKMAIGELLQGVDVTENVVVDAYSGDFFFGTLEDAYKNAGGNFVSFVELKKGVDYNFAITVNKAQGKGMNNPFFDLESIKNVPDKIIRDKKGRAVGSLRKSLEYVALSRAIEHIYVYGDKNTTFSNTIDAEKMALNTENAKKTVAEMADSIQEFTSNFVKTLLGVTEVPPKYETLGTNFSISDMLNDVMENGTTKSTFVDDGDIDEAMEHMSKFSVQKANIREVSNGLVNRGFIKTAPDGSIILLDSHGNMVDENGNFSGKPLKIKSLDSLENLKRIAKYLDKMKHHAEILFDVGAKPLDVVEDVVNFSNSIGKNGKGRYVLDGVELEGTTRLISEKFSSPFDIEEAAKKKVFYDTKTKLKKRYKKKGMTPDEAENKAIQVAGEYIGSRRSKDAEEEVKKIYEFKRTEGTFLHNINELYVLALNYSQEIDYGSGNKKSLTHFSEYIKKAIISGDKVALQKYFAKYFFNYLGDQQETPQYKQFRKAYEFVFNNVLTEDSGMLKDLLDNLEGFFKENIFKGIKGPVKMLPEVVIGDKELGRVGIIDLLVIDGDGALYIFDYKTKEKGKLDSWSYNKGSVRMLDEMGAYNDNAMMKASIQASVYKYILERRGFKVKGIAVAYIEADIRGTDEDKVFADKTKLRYEVKRIFKTHLKDVTADVAAYFRRVGIIKEDDNISNDAAEITALSIKGAGGVDVNTPKNIDATAEKIYSKAVNGGKGKGGNYEKIANKFGFAGKKAMSGLEVILPGNIRYTIPENIRSKEDRIAHIKDILVNRKDVAFVETNFEDVYYSLDRSEKYSKKVLGSRDEEKTFQNLLHGIDSTTHEFVKFSSNVNYGVDFKGVSFLKNKITGEVRIISLNYDDKKFIKFREGHFNILGNYISTRKLKAKYPELDNLKNTNYNLRLLKVGLMALRAKQLDPDFKVSHVLMNRDIHGDNKMPIKIDMLQLMALTKAFLTEAKAAGEVLPVFFEEALANPDIFNPDAYVPDPVAAISDYIGSIGSNRNVFNDVFKTKTARKRANALKKVIDNYDERRDYKVLLHALQELQHSLEGNFNSFEQKLQSDIWTVISNSILFVQGFNYTVNPKNTSIVQKFFFTPSTVSNKYMADFNRQITEGRAGMSAEFIAFKTEFNNLIQALADEKGISIDVMSSSLYKSSRKDVLKSLFVDPENKDKKKAFLLKAESDTNSKAEKALIRFINKSLKDFSKRSISRKSIDIKQGWLPLVKKSRMSRRSDTNFFNNALDSIKNTFSGGESLKNDIDSSDNYEKEFYVTNPFDSQLPSKNEDVDDQFNYARRKQLGLDEFMDPLVEERDSFNDIEDNIENMIDSFAVAALNVIHFKDISAFGRSMFYNIHREKGLTGENYDNVIDVLTIIQKKNIKNKESDDNNVVGEVFNTMATTAVIAGSIKQILLEAFTNPLITADNWLSDKLYGTLFGGQREFSSSSYRKAFNIISNPVGGKDKKLAEAIDLFYGFSNSDSRQMQEMMKMLEGKSIFQSKHLMYLNKLFLESWQKITMVAYMIEQGSFYAHSIDRNGMLIYDVKKDKRFYGGKDKLMQDKVREATKLKLSKEYGGLTGMPGDAYEDRQINKAYTVYDINYLKEKLVELYSSLDNSSKSMSIYYTWMAFINKMRTWIFAKMSRYFKKPVTAEENASLSRLERVDDPDAEGGYRMEWRGQAAEGILYSVFGITRMFKEEGFKALKSKNLTEVQKKNMSKLMADMFIGVVLSAAVWGMFKGLGDDDETMTETEQMFYDRFQMATGDVFMPKSLFDMAAGRGSLFIGISIITEAMHKALDAVAMTGAATTNPELDIEDVGAAYWQAASAFYGPFKSIDVGINYVDSLEE